MTFYFDNTVWVNYYKMKVHIKIKISFGYHAQYKAHDSPESSMSSVSVYDIKVMHRHKQSHKPIKLNI